MVVFGGALRSSAAEFDRGSEAPEPG